MVLDPYKGPEQGGERPVLILSTKAFSMATRYALIAPITKTIRNWPFEVLIGAELRVTGAVLTDQTRSVDFAARHAKFLGKAPAKLTIEVLARVASIVDSES